MAKLIEIDGREWERAADACIGLLTALRPRGAHGASIDAFVDSMIYGGLLCVEPPYEVVIRNIQSPEAAVFLRDLSVALAYARQERKANRGDDVDVRLRLIG
jgi:hypothetical protein